MLAMRAVKRIFVIALLMVFTVSVIASTAYAACNCADMTSKAMQQMESGDMPCHDMDKAEADEQNTAQCTDCACNDCKVPPQTSVINDSSASYTIASSMVHMLDSKVILSNVIFGIDNPPKHIS